MRRICLPGAFFLDPHNFLGVDPLLAPLADNGGPTLTFYLLPGSPAIDNGSNLDSRATDQRGFFRVIGIGPDIGAVETAEPASLALLAPALLLFRRPRTPRLP